MCYELGMFTGPSLNKRSCIPGRGEDTAPILWLMKLRPREGWSSARSVASTPGHDLTLNATLSMTAVELMRLREVV